MRQRLLLGAVAAAAGSGCQRLLLGAVAASSEQLLLVAVGAAMGSGISFGLSGLQLLRCRGGKQL